MRFTTHTNRLAEGLRATIAVATAGAKTSESDRGLVTLEVTRSGLTAKALGPGMAIITQLDKSIFNARQTDNGTITVRASDLANCLESLEPDRVIYVRTETQRFAYLGACKLELAHAADDKQVVPGRVNPVLMPPMPSTFTRKFIIKRAEFIQAARVSSFLGQEPFRLHFQHWALRVRPGGYRAVGGDGSRVLVYDKEGPSLVTTMEDQTYLFYESHTRPLLRVLKTVEADDLQIEQSIVGDQSTMVVTVGNTVLLLTGLDPTIRYPDVQKFMDRDNKLKFTVAIKDWSKQIEGVRITENEVVKSRHECHVARLSVDASRRSAFVVVDGPMRSRRSLPILDLAVEDGFPERTEICIASHFLGDMLRIGPRRGLVQFGFVNDHAPVVIEFFADEVVQDRVWRRDPATRTRERMLMFFAPSSPKTLRSEPRA